MVLIRAVGPSVRSPNQQAACWCWSLAFLQLGFCRCYPTYSYIRACPRTCVPECMQMSAHTDVPTICILSFLCFDFYLLRLPQIPYGVMAVFRLFIFVLISFPPPLTFPRFIPLGLSPFHFVFYFCCFLPGCLKRLPPDFE